MVIYILKSNASAVNGLSLAAIQGANAIFPLLVYPFLLSKMGNVAFSELVTTESLALLILVISLYSFDTTGIQSIIDARKIGNKRMEADYFFNILGARLGLFLAASLLMLIIYTLIGNGKVMVLVAWLGFVLGTILQCNYYFQATESNLLLASFVVVSRLISAAAIYFCISSQGDLLKASMILAGSFLLSGVAAYTRIAVHFREAGIRAGNFTTIISMLIQGRHLFFGNISVALFRGANVLILARVSNSTAVSSYAIAEKVIKCLQALARPVNQFYETKAVKAWFLYDPEKRSTSTALRLIWKSTRMQIYLMLFVIPSSIILIYLGHERGFLPGFDNQSFMLIYLMSPAVLFGVANSMFGVIGLNLINAQRYFARAVFSVGIGIFLCSILASSLFAATGAAFAYLVAEILLLSTFVMRYFQFPKYG
jgi:polysaccharide transporter, PST family